MGLLGAGDAEASCLSADTALDFLAKTGGFLTMTCCCCCWVGLVSNTHFSFLDDSDRRRSPGGHGERDFLGQSGGVIARDAEKDDEMDATAAAAAEATVFAMVGWEDAMVAAEERLFGPGFTFRAGNIGTAFCFCSLSLAHTQRTLTL